jgi:hypothetical protein
MHEAAAKGTTFAQGLLERVEHEARMRRARGAPADDPSRECVDDEGDVDEAGPSGDIGEIRHPQRIRARRLELPIDLVLRARRRLVAHRRSNRLAAHDALQTHGPHQPLDRATRHAFSLPQQLPPNLAHAINLEIVVEDAPDFLAQNRIAPRPRRALRGIAARRRMRPIGRRGDRQNLADRLDPVRLAMIVDEGDHGLNRRSSSAWAK